jgi:uncharacterized protein with HEPN domain
MMDDKLYLIHISEAIVRIETYTSSGRDEFMTSSLIQDAVARNFEIIGEAVKRLSDQLKDTSPEIPWHRIAGFRDVLIHAYDQIETTEVWNVIANDLLPLKQTVQTMLASLPDDRPS